MRKTILITTFVLLTFCFSPKVGLAAPKDFPWKDNVQEMINHSSSPLQGGLKKIQKKIADIEVNITNILSRLHTTETNIANILSRLNTTETNISSHEAKITNHETRITSLENMELGPDFNLPSSWTTTVSVANHQISVSSSRATGNTCSWNGVLLTQQVTIRGIAHLPDGDNFAIGTCDVITFKDIANFPTSGTNVPIDLHLFWQGKLKHTQITALIP